MNKKLLTKVGIGAGLLVLAYLAYKKFMDKPAETKSTEAEEAPANEPLETLAKVETSSPKKKISVTNIDSALPVSDKRKRGITSAEVDKIKGERKRLKELGVKGDALQSGLREFAATNGINFDAFQKLRERNEATRLANQFAGFMDIESRDFQDR